ncbi:two-component sensor histidine kinase [Actinorhabdospora filicis]|uniref:histidine kinase n=1 Tax=Actinorhabdospora filicis TaxID=1785913 RepID=A0A9W6SSQ4_9ACTN|nr:HAMP domain-containing sensor histidine kinase [Actinorhabdospora filicis]GLZ81612.1 two-component sensor histidine kinase [Actinorhabdospora filicis]
MVRTVGWRYTLLYAVVFLVSGVALLGLSGALSWSDTTSAAPAGAPPVAERERLRALEEERNRQLLVSSALSLTVMTAASLVLGRLLAGRVLRPLRTITAATRRITAENLHERLRAPGPDDEVKRLADTIDGLLERLEASFTAQRRFAANASHELRTPLTTMRASVDVALAKPGPLAESTVALAGRVRAELDRMEPLLEGLLLLARAQHPDAGERVPVTLRDLVDDALAARDRSRASVVADASAVRGVPALLAGLVDNLVANAFAHNRDGGAVRIAVAAGILTVENDGPELDPAQVAGLGTPFRRAAPERTGRGTGLGLSIVAAVAEAHGAVLELSARPAGGLRAVVAFPGEENR